MLASVRAANEQAKKLASPDTAKAPPDTAHAVKPEPKERALEVSDLAWNPQGTEAVVRLTSNDFKDRWLATVDLAKPALRPEHRSPTARG
jgi:hypothetical protein